MVRMVPIMDAVVPRTADDACSCNHRARVQREAGGLSERKGRVDVKVVREEVSPCPGAWCLHAKATNDSAAAADPRRASRNEERRESLHTGSESLGVEVKEQKSAGEKCSQGSGRGVLVRM